MIDFLANELFPCSRFIFNVRWNSTSTTGSQQRLGWGNIGGVASPEQMDRVTAHFLHNHRLLGPQRSMIMALEDFNAANFTAMAHWLGHPCTFHTIPHANDEGYGADYRSVDLRCA